MKTPTQAETIAKAICHRARTRKPPVFETITAVTDDLGPTLCRLTREGRRFIGVSSDLTGRVFCVALAP